MAKAVERARDRLAESNLASNSQNTIRQIFTGMITWFDTRSAQALGPLPDNWHTPNRLCVCMSHKPAGPNGTGDQHRWTFAVDPPSKHYRSAIALFEYWRDGENPGTDPPWYREQYLITRCGMVLIEGNVWLTEIDADKILEVKEAFAACTKEFPVV